MQKWMKVMAGYLCVLLPVMASASEAVQSFESESLTHIVASQKGKPFVLVVWSLDCAYCQASFNTLGQEKRKRKDLNVITLATDAVADAQVPAMITKKLKAAGLVANAWAFGTAPPEQLRFAIDAGWHGELPRSYWFNTRGERVAYSGVITPATVEKLFAAKAH